MQDFPWPKLLAGLLAVLAAGLTLGIVIDDDQDPQTGTHHRTITVRVDTADRGRTADEPMRVPAAAVDQAAAQELGDHEAGRSENPVGVTRGQLDAAREQQEQLAADDQLPTVTPDAAPSQRGCRSRFVGSFSSRRGVAPRLIVIHYTVSPNRPGWGDVDGVTALFARPSFQASSNYVIDREGHCNYIVRESDKAWTQAAANPVSISFELINSGHEPTLIDGAGLDRLGQVVSDAARRWNIPLQLGAVAGCTVARAGIVTHQMLGACGGGHVDVSPYPVAPVLAAATRARAPAPRVTARDRRDCKAVRAYRDRRRAHKPKTAGGAAAFNARLARVRGHEVRCADGRAVLR